jgi:hypothetical protein
MTALAVVLAALGACGYAVGARLQHSGVHDTIGDRGFGVRSQMRLVRNRGWLLGLVALGSGALLHVSALGLAPLSVIQPMGVLALPITVLLNAQQEGQTLQKLHRSAVFAVLASAGGAVGFVVLAAHSATATPVAAAQEVRATQFVAVAVVTLAIAGVLTRAKIRCIAYAAGCAVAYGYVSLLMRGVAQQIGNGRLSEIDLGPLVGIVVAMAVGGWLLQHSYASGPPDLAVACLTVIDPMVAVGLGIGLLGEADRADVSTVAGELLCAVVASAGVFALARFRPETHGEQVPSTVGGAAELARPSSTDRPDGSTT